MAYREFDSQRGRDNRDNRIRFDLIEHLCVLRSKDNGWNKEANIVSWNGGAEKLDIREWDSRHERMTKGITLFPDEAEALAIALADKFGLRAKPTFSVSPTRSYGQQPVGHQPYRGSGSAQVGGSTSEFPGESASQWETAQEEDIPFDRMPEPATQWESAREDNTAAELDSGSTLQDNSSQQNMVQPDHGDEVMAVAENCEAGSLQNTEPDSEAAVCECGSQETEFEGSGLIS